MNYLDRIVKAHDAGDIGAKSCQSISSLAVMVGMAIQDTGREGRGHAELLLNRQLQVPDRPQRQKQDQNIGQDVDSACHGKIEVRFDTFAWDRFIPRFGYGAALEDDGEHVSEVEADV